MIKTTNAKSSNRSFGILFFVIFFIIAVYPLINKDDILILALVFSLIFLYLGLVNSKILTPLKIIWLKFGLLLGKLVSPIVIGIIYFLLIVPTGLIIKLFIKNYLALKKDNKIKTYWIEKKDVTDMKNQF